MPERGLIQKKLWGRSLYGLLAAVGVAILAAYTWCHASLIGFRASKRTASPYYAEYLAQYQFWAIITLALLVASAILLGVGVRPKSRLDQLLAWSDERWERWLSPLRRFFGRLFFLAFVVHLISILHFLFVYL